MDEIQTLPSLPTAPTLAPPAPSPAEPTHPVWGPPGSEPGPTLPALFSPIPEEPKRRGRVFMLLAIVALVVVGVGALFALRGGDGGSTVVEVEDASAFSLSAAAESATEASTVRYEMNMSMGGLGEFSMIGGIDNDAQIMTMTMDMGAFLGGEGLPQIDAIIDVGNGVMYMSNPGMGFPTDAPWISMDISALADQSGVSMEELQDQLGADPLDVASLFTEADEVVDLGADTIDGVEVRHYQVTVDFAEAMAANPQVQQQVDLGGITGELPTELVYDVWVTEDNQLRRMTFATEMLGQEFVVEMNVTDVGEPLDVQIPPAGDVEDLTGMLGF